MKRLIAAAALMCAAVPAMAGDDMRRWSCGELWSTRNAIYKEGGYCFRTSRGIREFGNAGCRYDDVNDVPLSANQRGYVAEIVRVERAKGCPR
jgi:YARHG domain